MSKVAFSSIPLVLLLLGSAHAADIPVSPGQSVQSAIVAASPGDRILLGPGIYPEAIDFLGKSIEVIGVAGAAATTLDATGLNKSVVTFKTAEPASAKLRGVTVRGGTGSPISIAATTRYGGGILAINSAGPTIEDCQIVGNSADYGGGVYDPPAQAPSAVLLRCVIAENAATIDGGGTVSCFLQGCVVRLNSAGQSGGGCMSPGAISDSLIDRNSASLHGGGVFSSGAPVIQRSRFLANQALRGGGVHVFQTFVNLSECVFVGNKAFVEAGGAHITSVGSITLFRCMFANNDAFVDDGVKLVTPVSIPGKSAEIVQCSFWNDRISVPYADTTTLRNSILHADFTSPLIVSKTPAQISYSLVPSDLSGVGVIHGDPQFVDSTNGDLHLRATSPCIGAGQVEFFPPGFDFEGDSRGASWDIGADEFEPHLYVVGIPTSGEYSHLGVVGPAGSIPLVFVSATLATAPVSTPYGSFVLGLPLLPLSPLVLPTLGPTGSSILQIILPPTVPSPATIHLQAFLGGPNILTNPLMLLID